MTAGPDGAAESNGAEKPDGGPRPDSPESLTREGPVDVAIIGSGFGGLSAVHYLREAGIRDVVVLERASDVGGTWRDNDYPGAACDVPSHLYSLSFAPNPGWTRTYSAQGEIQAYLQRVAADMGMDRITRFGCEVLDATWDEDGGVWRILTSEGGVTARFLITAAGALADPVLPDVDGIDSLTVPAFHSARWAHDIDLTGKRVAIVGTGASAIQIVPELQPMVERLYLLQRTPPWVLPRTDRPISSLERLAYRRLPLLQKAVRGGIYLTRELLVPGFRHPRLAAGQHRLALAHLRRQVSDPELRARLTPDYMIGCKRILQSNVYYPAVAARNVELLDALGRVDGDRLTTADGHEREIDALVFCTGFAVQDMPIAHRISRPGFGTLYDTISGGSSGLMGATFAGFPNLFMLLGPNTGLGHTSQVFMIESQARLAAALLGQLRAQGADLIELGTDVEDRWAQTIQRLTVGTVWTTGNCASWYLSDEGRNTTLWPTSTIRYRRETNRVSLADFDSGRIGFGSLSSGGGSSTAATDPISTG